MINEKIKKIIKNNINEDFKNYDEEIKQKLINTSINSLEKHINELKNAIEEKNKEKTLFSSHAIKGIFLNTKCPDLAEDFNDAKLKSLSLEEIKKTLTNSIQKIV